MNKQAEDSQAIYEVMLEVNQTQLKAKGDTIFEALNKLKAPDVIKTLGRLYITKGDQTHRKVFNTILLRRFFVNETYRKILAKTFSFFVK